MIMISGENFGGFYAIYILMALPFGGLHALLALAGIITLLTNHAMRRNGIGFARSVFDVLGVLLLFASLFYFFWADKQHYNYGSFQQAIPLLTMMITAAVAICVLVRSFFFSGKWAQIAGPQI